MAAYLTFDLDAKTRVPLVARAAGCSPGEIAWGLLELWEHVWRSSQGVVTRVVIEGCFGPDPKRLEALEAFGFVEPIDDGFRVRGADRYLRVREAQKASAHRTNEARKKRSTERSTERSSEAKTTVFQHSAFSIQQEANNHVELASSTGQGDAFELIPSQPPTPPKPKRAPSEALDAGLTADEREVFDHWRRVCGHQRAKLDAKRRKLLRERLRDYSAEDLKAAVDGCSRSPHHQGQNDRNTRYDDLELILRDAKHVEQFMILAGNGNGCDF